MVHKTRKLDGQFEREKSKPLVICEYLLNYYDVMARIK